MEVLKFIEHKKNEYNAIKDNLNADMRTADKLGFTAQLNKLVEDRNCTLEIINLLNDVSRAAKKERLFTEDEISKLQTSVHKITGDGEVMGLFNSLLGVSAG